MGKQVLVGIAMGSDSDLSVMQESVEICKQFGIAYELRVVSAHRTPDDMADYGRNAEKRGLKVIIAGAGGAAHLPGMLAAHTNLPVIGIPVPSKHLAGLDSLYSIVQMPPGVPVACMSIGGAKNAGILAAQILALDDEKLAKKLALFRKNQSAESRAKNKNL